MLSLLLLPLLVCPSVRTELSIAGAAAAWGHDWRMFRGLARVEAGPDLEWNPRRYGTRERWGAKRTRATRPWRYCGLYQLAGGAVPMGQPDSVRFPPCSLLVLSPEMAAWYGAMHLAGWRRHCGAARMYEGFNAGGKGCRGETDGSFTRAVQMATR